jgi:uracil phosphoribosyltransferase
MQPVVAGNVIVVKANCFAHLYTAIRDKNTHPVAWRKAALRIMNVGWLYLVFSVV